MKHFSTLSRKLVISVSASISAVVFDNDIFRLFSFDLSHQTLGGHSKITPKGFDLIAAEHDCDEIVGGLALEVAMKSF